jgi:hypothetical protein
MALLQTIPESAFSNIMTAVVTRLVKQSRDFRKAESLKERSSSTTMYAGLMCLSKKAEEVTDLLRESHPDSSEEHIDREMVVELGNQFTIMAEMATAMAAEMLAMLDLASCYKAQHDCSDEESFTHTFHNNTTIRLEPDELKSIIKLFEEASLLHFTHHVQTMLGAVNDIVSKDDEPTTH